MGPSLSCTLECTLPFAAAPGAPDLRRNARQPEAEGVSRWTLSHWWNKGPSSHDTSDMMVSSSGHHPPPEGVSNGHVTSHSPYVTCHVTVVHCHHGTNVTYVTSPVIGVPPVADTPSKVEVDAHLQRLLELRISSKEQRALDRNAH